MTDSRFSTSELPVTQIVKSTDRILILSNATGVGGSPMTMMIPVANLFSNLSFVNSLSLGNSSVNVSINSTSVYIQNSGDVVFSVDTSGKLSGTVNSSSINGLACSAFVDTTNANNITTGTLSVPFTGTFTGTANNTLYVGNLAAANVVSNDQLQANLIGIAVGNIDLSVYQTTAGLAANVATLTSNNAFYIGGLIASNVVSNAQLQGNLSLYQTAAGLAANVAALGYISNAQLAANVATLTSNNALYLGGTIASGYQTIAGLAANVAALGYSGGGISNAQLQGNLSLYQTSAGLAANVAVLPANNALYLGGTIASGYQTTAGLAANVAVLPANNALYLGGVIATSYVVNSGNYTLSGNISLVPATTGGIPLNIRGVSGGTANLISVGNNTTAAQFAVNSIGVMVGNGAGITSIMLANNATNLGGTIASGYQTTAGLAANVAVLPANNALYLGGVIAASYTNTVQLTNNLALYPTNTQFQANITNYQTTAGLSANVATLTSNNTLYVGNIAAANVVSNAQLQANLVGIITGNISGTYQTIAGLASSVATLTANNTSYVGTVAAANVVSNAQLVANLANYPTNTQFQANITNYQTTAGLAANVATLPANNASYLGGVAAASYVNTIGNYTLSGNISLVPATTGGIPLNIRGVSGGTANLFQVGNNTTAAQFAVNSIGIAVGNGQGITSILLANNATNLGGIAAGSYTNTVQLTNNLALYPTNTQFQANITNYQTTAGLAANVATLPANNALYLGGVIAASYTNTVQLTNNLANFITNTQFVATIATYQTTAGLATNVATLTSNSAAYIGGLIASFVVSNAQLVANLANYPTNTQFQANLGNYQTTAGLSVNVATLTSNNTSYVGNLAAANVVSDDQLLANLASTISTLMGVDASNNSLYLGGVPANGYVNTTQFTSNLANYPTNTQFVANLGNYVNTIGNYTLSGNITFSPATTGGIPLNIRGVSGGTANLFSVGNSTTAAQFAVNSIGVMVGNGAGITSVTASIVANSGIVSNATGIFANIGAGLSFVSGAITATGVSYSGFSYSSQI